MINPVENLSYGDFFYRDWARGEALPVCPVLARYQRTNTTFNVGAQEEAVCIFILRAEKNCTVFSGGKIFFCRAGECYVLPAGRRAEWSPAGQMEYLALEIADRIGLLGTEFVRIEGCPGAAQKAMHLAGKLADGSLEDPYAASEAAYALCMDLRRVAEQPQQNLPPLVTRALAIFQTQYAYIMGASDAADMIGVSHEHFNRVFTQSVGVTPGRYLRGIRIENAKKLLAETNDTIEIIAKTTGFEGGNYFCRVFKTETGETPGQYRRRCVRQTAGQETGDIALY